MSCTQFHCIKMFILRHAWLNLWDKHMTTGRINQVTSIKWNHSNATKRAAEIHALLLLSFPQTGTVQVLDIRWGTHTQRVTVLAFRIPLTQDRPRTVNRKSMMNIKRAFSIRSAMVLITDLNATNPRMLRWFRAPPSLSLASSIITTKYYV